MKILILSASLPYPPASGGAIRAWGILRGLAQAGHRVTLLSFGDQPAADSPLHAICEQIITVPAPNRGKFKRIQQLIFSTQPDIATRLYSPQFVATLSGLLRQHSYDLIQFEGIEIACYLPLVKQMQTRAKLCFDTFNAEAQLQRVIYEIDRQEPRRWLAAFYSLLQSQRIHRYESMLCRIADLVLAVSAEDAALLSQYQPQRPVRVISSGIDVADYQHATPAPANLPANSLVFTGKMDYRPNVDAMLWFTQAILPHIPQAHLAIVGQQPHARIQQLAQQQITITGWVASVLPYLHAAAVYVAPLRMGSGTRLKLLEALASGCAIVATSIAAAGLTPQIRQAMLIADSESDFRAAIIRLLENADLRQQLARRGQLEVQRQYDWSVIIPQLLVVYQEAEIG